MNPIHLDWAPDLYMYTCISIPGLYTFTPQTFPLDSRTGILSQSDCRSSRSTVSCPLGRAAVQPDSGVLVGLGA